VQPSALLAIYDRVRSSTVDLCAPLAIEDYVVQASPEASPAKWHLAHTSWFFETFVLHAMEPNRRSADDPFAMLFNSYYQSVGDALPRAERGRLSRPTVAEVLAYRQRVDQGLHALLDDVDDDLWRRWAPVVELGIAHEEQHQELLLTDLKLALAGSPLATPYGGSLAHPPGPPTLLGWIHFDGGLRTVGAGGDGFAFDNERPRHRVLVDDFALATRPVTCGEYRTFIAEGGYQRPELWLSDGWEVATRDRWEAPLYWRPMSGDGLQVATLAGLRPLCDGEPVCHVSFFEADAYARWAGARLPTEAEWEIAAAALPTQGNLLDTGRLHPHPDIADVAADGRAPRQLFGDVWEWTASPYAPYPGFTPLPGALGEYNGKFMCNQWVLRGGSCVTPRRHIRPTYRNFFRPETRWQFTGIRLAR
jgi:ergothioneine biosynthesis protein EgtB